MSRRHSCYLLDFTAVPSMHVAIISYPICAISIMFRRFELITCSLRRICFSSCLKSISALFFPGPFHMCKFLCGCISSMICLLRNLYIWERLPFSWYPNSFEPPCFLSIILWWFQICLVSACLVFIGIFTHSCICWIFWLHAYHGEHVEFYWLNVLTSFWHFQLVLVSNWSP